MDAAPRSGCPINAAVEVLGDPWAMLVLRDIMFGTRRHFRELVAGSEEGIATNILARRLKQLVAAGLLTRDDARRGQRAAYSLTEAGIQVLPVMVALGNWGWPTATANTACASAPSCFATRNPSSWPH
jgi:DNA-binding HxlR family transcriptional regulator